MAVSCGKFFFGGGGGCFGEMCADFVMYLFVNVCNISSVQENCKLQYKIY